MSSRLWPGFVPRVPTYRVVQISGATSKWWKKVWVIVLSQPRALAIADVGQIHLYVVVKSCRHGAGVGVIDLEYRRDADNATSQVAIGQRPVVKLGLPLRAAALGYQGKR
jgi:hypothetical protein